MSTALFQLVKPLALNVIIVMTVIIVVTTITKFEKEDNFTS